MQESTPPHFHSRLIRLALCSFAASTLACNHPLDPRGSLDSQLVVYSVLSTDQNAQFVRVERNYMPVGFEAQAYTMDNFVPNATVTIQTANATYTLRDTSFARLDTTRYKFPLRAYFTQPLTIEHGASYRVTVQSNLFRDATTSIMVPAKPSIVIYPSSVAVLQFPSTHDESDDIAFTIDLGQGSAGWIGRFYLYYNVLQNGVWIEDRDPVPVSFIYPKTFNYLTYGEMSQAINNNHTAAVYSNRLYEMTLTHIGFEKYPNHKIKFTRAVLQLLQVEENIYNYYQIVHANNDPHSMRLDEPMFTNLVGGVGVVGAYTLDSLVQPLPDNFAGNRY